MLKNLNSFWVMVSNTYAKPTRAAQKPKNSMMALTYTFVLMNRQKPNSKPKRAKITINLFMFVLVKNTFPFQITMQSYVKKSTLPNVLKVFIHF